MLDALGRYGNVGHLPEVVGGRGAVPGTLGSAVGADASVPSGLCQNTKRRVWPPPLFTLET
ncbi:hypothetical protein GCM10010425_65830 [Streptomyces spororaveus]